jgi:hypothetical protein
MRSSVLSSLILCGPLALAGTTFGQEHAHHHSGHPGTHTVGVAPGGGAPAAPAPVVVELGGNQYNYNSYYNTNYDSYWGTPGFLTVGYGYRPFYRFGWYGGGYGPYAYPPVVLPAQTLFGPQPVQQMMGVNQVAANQAGPVQRAGVGAAPRPQRKVRVANAEAKARAGKFIDFGDALFAKQRFREALERYKLAAQQAPDMAEIYLRQGIASVATGQFEAAGRYFRRALKTDGWDAAHLQLDQLYGADRIAKESHLEA